MDPIAAARDNANQAQTAYGQAQQAAATLPDMLKTALSTKLGDNNPIVNDRSAALSKYFQESGQAPLDVTAKSAGGNSDYVFNPAQQQALITARRGAALAPVSGLNALFGLEVGGLPYIINSTANAYNAQVVGLGNKAASARQAYQDLIQEEQMRQAQQAAAAAAAEQKRQFDLNYQLDKYKAEKTGNGGGSADFSMLLPYLSQMMGGGQATNNQSDWEDITNQPRPGLDLSQAMPGLTF